MSDRSLDEFAAASDAGEEADVDGDGNADPTPDDTADAPDASPDPATPTMRWAADAVCDDCDDCDAAVSRRWRDGDAFVCADCKEW